MSLNSPFSKMFEAIMQRISNTTPEIKHIDQDMGQLEGTSTRAAVMFPCILVDFKNFIFDDLGDDIQRAEGDIIIKLAYAQFTPSSDKVDAVYREQALDYYEIEYKLNSFLHGWSPGDEFSVLSRRNADSQNVLVGVRARPLTYRVAFEDYSARPSKTIIHPPIDFVGNTN